MAKWQYSIYSQKIIDADLSKPVATQVQIQEYLDKAGRDGWELVAAVPFAASGYVMFVVKKPL
jgi:hypothetical protein